jgi:hypothetical protein
MAKGDERLPPAWRAILYQGHDDVEALMTLAERMGIDLRCRNIAVTDCGGRDSERRLNRFSAHGGGWRPSSSAIENASSRAMYLISTPNPRASRQPQSPNAFPPLAMIV